MICLQTNIYVFLMAVAVLPLFIFGKGNHNHNTHISVLAEKLGRRSSILTTNHRTPVILKRQETPILQSNGGQSAEEDLHALLAILTGKLCSLVCYQI